MIHQSVLLNEVLDNLALEAGDIYLDATSGSGGHLEGVWNRMGSSVTLCGIDADSTSVSIAQTRLELLGAKSSIKVLNFRNIDKAIELLGMQAPTKILFDLGWSSDQFEEGKRGFSFQKDEPLLMTFASSVGEDDTTAYDVVNRWGEENLADVIYGYGDEKYSRRIAKAIMERRMEKPILTTGELVEVIKSAVPIFYRFGRIHFATRTFQAIRIAVNDELRSLETGLTKAFEILKPSGRMAVISFHSLEDRIVKNFFRQKQEEEKGEIINKKPIVATAEEIEKNPRARSGKLRVIKKI